MSQAEAGLSRRLAAEALGSAGLLATVVGSGIMGEKLADGNVAIALLANSLATGAGLIALILTFGPISGAHFNPAVTLAAAGTGGLRRRDVLPYVIVQVLGAILGVWVAHAMFDLPILQVSSHERTGAPQWIAEFVATFGLIGTIHGVSRRTPAATPFAVAAYIVAAYWFTASTSFANPAVTLARALTHTFAGIRPADVPGFIVAQLLGAWAASATFRWLASETEKRPVQTVLFACVHNAGRSQMAAAFFNRLADPLVARAVSAGTEPGERVHPEVVRAMEEVDLDLSWEKPQKLTPALAAGCRFLVTMGCGESCPVTPPGVGRLDWPLDDPKGKSVERVREIREDVRARVAAFVAENGWSKRG